MTKPGSSADRKYGGRNQSGNQRNTKPRNDQYRAPRDRTPPAKPTDHQDGVRDWDDGLGDIDLDVLSREVQEDLKTLKTGIRVKVERLLAAAQIAMQDGELDQAYDYATQAGQLGGRSPVVRETVGVSAYTVGDFKKARSELQAAVRMGGSPDLLPMIADCERGLGRPEKAIELLTEPTAESLDGPAGAERLLVLAGARLDLGQITSAMSTLKLPASEVLKSQPWAARIVYGYADALLANGDTEAARQEFVRCVGLDEIGQTDATERLDEIDLLETQGE